MLTTRSDIEFLSTKLYPHSIGLSCVFRQWKATDSHCQYPHGYSIAVKQMYGCTELDHRNWVQDFGGLKPIKQWLEQQFDHKWLVAEDDPARNEFEALGRKGLAQINVVEAVGCEAFSLRIFEHIEKTLRPQSRVNIVELEVAEHEGNSAIVRRKPSMFIPDTLFDGRYERKQLRIR